ncbi:MAG: head GIN domain-containing protein [Bacteroidota bacterium]
MKLISVLIVVAGLMGLVACDELLNENFHGKGPMISNTLKVGSFDEVEVSNSMKLFIRQGEKSSVVVKCQENILERIKAKVRSGRLELELDYGSYQDVNISVYITVPNIKYIGGSGASQVEMSHFDKLNTLELDFSGATEFIAVGQESNVDNLIVDISGAGDLQAFLLKCRRIDLDISGASSCEVYATEMLNLDLSGASEVRYKGKPRINQDVSGASSVESVE